MILDTFHCFFEVWVREVCCKTYSHVIFQERLVSWRMSSPFRCQIVPKMRHPSKSAGFCWVSAGHSNIVAHLLHKPFTFFVELGRFHLLQSTDGSTPWTKLTSVNLPFHCDTGAPCCPLPFHLPGKWLPRKDWGSSNLASTRSLWNF